MALLPKLAVLLVVGAMLSSRVSGDDHCDLPLPWYDTIPLGATAEEWWCEYDPANQDLIVYTFSDESIDREDTGEHGSCAAKYEDPETMFTTVLFKMGDGSFTCIEAWAIDHVMMIATWKPATTVFIDDCVSYFANRVSWQLWANVPFKTASTPAIVSDMPFPEGEYILSYEYGSDGIVQCPYDGSAIDSVLTLAGGNQITTSTCNGDPASFEYPLNSLIVVVGVAPDEAVLPEGEEGPSQGFLMLAYPTGNNKYLFYCARYRVVENSLEITLLLESSNYARCYAREEDYPTVLESSFKWLKLQLRSAECVVSKPCMNGGTCVQLWNDYTCDCPAGFAGQSCEFDLSLCDSWAAWSRCSHPCGGCGTKVRTRVCPPEFPVEPSITDEAKICGLKKCIKGIHPKTEVIKTVRTNGRVIAYVRDRQCCYDFRQDPPKELPRSKACIRKAASGWRNP